MAVLQQITARVREAQQTFNSRWEERARTSIAIRELTSLGDRDLRDMGISRGDIPRLVREERNWRQA
ncbi:MAG: DUF1127 domain-containing protein [Burkholderiaceae bacterium]|nr:DUF1127 domain-containing protein [Burkholderiaceae bacterium]